MTDTHEKPIDTEAKTEPAPEDRKAVMAAQVELADKLATKLLRDTLATLQKGPKEQGRALEVALALVLRADVPEQVILMAVEQTMPLEWRKHPDECAGAASLDAQEKIALALGSLESSELRVFLAMSALYWQLGYAQGVYVGLKAREAKG